MHSFFFQQSLAFFFSLFFPAVALNLSQPAQSSSSSPLCSVMSGWLEGMGREGGLLARSVQGYVRHGGNILSWGYQWKPHGTLAPLEVVSHVKRSGMLQFYLVVQSTEGLITECVQDEMPCFNPYGYWLGPWLFRNKESRRKAGSKSVFSRIPPFMWESPLRPGTHLPLKQLVNVNLSFLDLVTVT